MRAKVSACLMTYNEEANIERALSGLTWCDEIIVLDCYSTDRTVELARQYTDRIHQNEWKGFIAQRNRLRELAEHPWVLFLDADEEVTPFLRAEIEQVLRTDGERFAGFRIPRMSNYLGRWIRHGEWYPDMTLRLFLRERGHSTGEEPHDKVVVDGPVRNLTEPLRHYSHENVQDHVQTINNFSSISAEAKHQQGVRFHFRDLLLRPPWRFFKGYILKRGFMDGWRGCLIAQLNMFATLLKYAKMWELELEAARRPPAATEAKPAPRDG